MRGLASWLVGVLAGCGGAASEVAPAEAPAAPVAAPEAVPAVAVPAAKAAGPDGLTNGDVLLDFTLPRVDGQGTWRLYDHVAPDGTGAKQAALIAFTASWCGPCRQSLPTLAEIEKANPDLAIVILSIDEKPSEHQIEAKAIAEAGLNAPFVIADEATQRQILGENRRIPRFLFLNKVAELLVQDRGFGDKVRPMMPKQAAYALKHPEYVQR